MAVLGVIAMFVGISILVIAHELGHAIAAWMVGASVARFSVGFGSKAVLRRTIRGTLFELRPIPLGGFVQIPGQCEDNAAENIELDKVVHEGGLSPEQAARLKDQKRWFNRLPGWKQAVIIAAGPFASILPFPLLWFACIYTTVGTPELTEPAKIIFVLEDSTSGRLGIKPGDVVISVNAITNVTSDILEQQRVNASVRVLKVQRGSQRFSFTVRGNEKLGVGFESCLKVEPLRVALPKAYSSCIGMISMQREAMQRLVKRPAELKNTSSIIGIVKTGSTIYQFDPGSWLSFIGILSIAIGFMNLIPLGPLDGGQLCLAIAKTFTGREVARRPREIFLEAGTVLLLLLFLAAVLKDIVFLIKGSL